MSLVGSLEDLSLLDILQIVNVSRRTGVLRLSPPDLGCAYIYFSTGSVSDIVGDFDELHFLRFFESQDLVDRKEMEQALAFASGKPMQALHRMLQAGVLNRSFLEQARRLELSKRLKALTQFGRGEFLFSLSEDGDEMNADWPTPFCPLDQPVSPQNLLTQTITDSSFAEWAPPRPARPRVAPSGPPPPSAPAPVRHEAVPPPASEAVPLPSPAPAPRDHAAAPVPTDQAKSKVAVVLAADESIFKTMLRARLHKHFAQVLPVASLAEYTAVCSGLLEQRKPFLALTDLLMPTSDGVGYLGGLELLEKSSLSFPQVKVVLMSDLEDDRIMEMAKLKGAVAVLGKPALSQIRVDQFEASINGFAEVFCREVDRLLPPVEEEVATFYKDLGVESVDEGYRVRDQLSLLKGLMGELASPRESSEISLLVLRLAAEYFERAILFLVKKDEILGLGGFGETGDPEKMMQKVRRLRIPVGVGSIFDDAIQSRSTAIRSRQGFSRVDSDFAQALGTQRPEDVVAIPMVSRNRVVAILYADNASGGESLPDLSGIEIFMAQAGLAMEKALLERQLLSLKRSIPNQLQEGPLKEE